MSEASFDPTLPMRRAKIALHRNCPLEKVTNLLPSDGSLAKFIAPTPLRQIILWQEKYGEEFWLWFITPESDDGKEHLAKDLAKNALISLLKIRIVDEDGNLCVEPDVAKLVQKSAETVLAKGTPMIAIQNNTVNSGVPRGIKGKTAFQLEDRMKTITKHMPQPSKPAAYIEGEIDDNSECGFVN